MCEYVAKNEKGEYIKQTQLHWGALNDWHRTAVFTKDLECAEVNTRNDWSHAFDIINGPCELVKVETRYEIWLAQGE